MKYLKIIRVSGFYGTFGVLTINGIPFCVTLERKDMDNMTSISCINTGHYIIKPYNSPKYGWTWQVQDVPGRTYILFHAGNWVKNTKGCILLAQHYGKLSGNLAVLNSGNTFKKFKAELEGSAEHHLTICESY